MQDILIALDFHGASVWLIRLLLAAVLGAIIGFEREAHGQTAGLRTYAMIALGSCLLMMLSIDLPNIFRDMDASSTLRIDPGRIASYAVAGMGFLGAGAIIKGKGTIRGLTTASGLWLATGIGLSVGAGYYLPAIITTVIALLILFSLRRVKERFSHDLYTLMSIRCSYTEDDFGTINRIMAESKGIDVLFINYSHDIEANSTHYRLRLRCKVRVDWKVVVDRVLHEVKGLRSVSWEESDVP